MTTPNELSTEDFAKLAIERYGEDKIIYKPILVTPETETILKIQGWTDEDIAEIRNYLRPWVSKCPECDEELGGIFGSFVWGIVHGIGYCSNCKKTEFRLYHYFGKQKFEAFELIAFPRENMEE